MLKVSRQSSPWKYFYWLAFIGALFLISELLRVAPVLRSAHFSWVDVLATYSLLGILTTIFALLAAVLLSGIERLFLNFKSKMMKYLPEVILFALFLVLWTYILFMALVTVGSALVRTQIPAMGALLGMIGVQIAEQGLTPRLVAVLGASGIALIAFPVVLLIFRRASAAILKWMAETTGRLRVVAWIFIIACLPLALFLFLEPLSRGQAAPIVVNNSKSIFPNIVIIILDAVTPRDTSLYGYPLSTTPTLDRLAPSWIVCENAHSTATNSVVALPAILTGRYPYLDEWYRYGDLVHAEDGWMSLPQILKVLGYETACLTSAYPPARYHMHTNFDEVIENEGFFWNFLNFTPFISRAPQESINDFKRIIPLGRWEVFEDATYKGAKEYFRKKAKEDLAKPFFLYLHTGGAHVPYAGGKFSGTFLRLGAGLLDFEEQRRYYGRAYSLDEQPIMDLLRLRYDEAILKTDEQVRHIIDLLKQLNQYENSLIIITADHGQNFASGYQGHNTPLLSGAEHNVPLLIKLPRQVQGKRITALASHVDILPTVLDSLGISYPNTWIDGQSILAPRVDIDRLVYVRLPEESLGNKKETMAVLSSRLKLVRRNNDFFLFNIEEDPDEQVNLMGKVSPARLNGALNQFVHRMDFLRSGGQVTKAPELLTAPHRGIQ